MDYTDIVDGLKRLNNAITMRRMNGGYETAEAAARFLLEVRNAVDAINERVRLLNASHDLLRHAEIPDIFDRAAVTSVSLLGNRFTRTSQLWAKERADKEASRSWLRNNELGDLITETVPAQSLSATARSLAEENESLPDDLFETYLKSNISITKIAK